jgi:hypothetical protein
METAQNAIPALKVAAVARFNSIRQSIYPSSDGTKSQDTTFPPSHWDLGSTQNDGAGASDWQYLKPQSPSNLPQPLPEPNTFAMKLRSLIEQLPLPSPSSASTKETGDDTADATTSIESNGEERQAASPIPPGVDPEVAQLLSSEQVMSGNADNGDSVKGKESIWSILERLGRSKFTNEGSESSKAAVDKAHTEDVVGVYLFPLMTGPNTY